MAKGSRSSYTLALVLSQALWVLPGVQPASAQALPPNFISPNVPHDVPAGSAASVADLAVFAWQEFIALNWVAMDPPTTGLRGRPNTALDTDAGFLGIAPDGSGEFPLVVWQTYRHKVELFPADGQTDSLFDSKTPTYKYPNPAPTPAVGGQIPSFNLFNNLDETSQIGLCNMYAHATSDVEPAAPAPATGIRVAYEAKVNRAVFNYANNPNNPNNPSNPSNPLQALTSPSGDYLNLFNALSNTKRNLAQFGGICSFPSGPNAPPLQPIVMLPCGDNSVAGDAGEGAIEIKAAWRRLTAQDTISHFFTQNVLFYTGSQVPKSYNNAVWGLVALHIIHKTKSFPAFVFATWEQVDNFDDDASPPANTENLAFQNTGTPLGNIAVTRANPIHSQVAATNDLVHAAFKAGNAATIWQYYKLIGVQATPVDGPPPATASADDLSYYFLANIMVETNQTLQNFTGGAPAGIVFTPAPNVTVAGQTVQMGGCQGCHGFQAQLIGGDMSRLLGAGAFNATASAAATPESLEAGVERSVTTYRQRSKGVLLLQGLSLPKGVSRGQVRHGTTYPKCCR